jgi:hemerythrin
MLLGYRPMDAVHQEFVDCVSALQRAGDAQLPAALAALELHAVAHFSDEDRWMVETDFPARECHINEHAAVLKSVREVRALLEQGNTQVCRRLGLELARWFPGHADYLDSALAHWMCKQRLGGKPVVVRRDLGWRRNSGDNSLTAQP